MSNGSDAIQLLVNFAHNVQGAFTRFGLRWPCCLPW
nr:hypothetical protein 345p2_00052 [Serratia entomophila]